MFRRIVFCFVLATSSTACTAIRPDGWGTEWKHDSALLAGQPFEKATNERGQGREDTLDVWNNYLFWQRPNWYAEVGVGVKLREGGFYVDPRRPPVIFNGRFGRRFDFKK